MSMLAEPRRKQKWSLNPRGKYWSDDPNKLGQKMLEKMGWSSGKGLGANQQGITEHIKIAFKNDIAGIGYDKNRADNAWTEHHEKFNDLLQQLQTNQEQKIIQEPESKDDVLSGQSLELKSKQSRVRVHYQKFTRGKDVNKYSSKDLANILGQKELSSKVMIKVEKDKNIDEKEAVGTKDTRGGIITFNSGSMVDYFNNKKSNRSKSLPIDNRGAANSDNDPEKRAGFGFASKVDNEASSNYITSKNYAEKSDYAFDNPCLGLNSPTEAMSNTDDSLERSMKKKRKKENAGLCINEIDKFNVRKKLKTDVIDNYCKDGFTNPALNLNIEPNENCNGREFEVSRAQFGLENCGLDLTDESNNKKRVTFNDHVEYNIDSTKKKKGKATLDKFEVENKKCKKKRKHENITTSVSIGFVNEALDVETLSEEINDNEFNEHKSKNNKKKKICKTSNLETIPESPEREEQITEVVIDSETITLDTSFVENKEIHSMYQKPKEKKKKKKKAKNEDITVVDITNEDPNIEIEETIKRKKIKIKNNKEGEIATSKKRKKEKKKVEEDNDAGITEETEQKRKTKKNSEKETSDKENADKDQGTEAKKLSKKTKKHNKSKEDILDTENSSDINTEIKNVDIIQDKKERERIENIGSNGTPAKKNKVNDVIDNKINSPCNGKAKISKKMLKLFYSNSIDFPGSNIHEIKGYGADIEYI